MGSKYFQNLTSPYIFSWTIKVWEPCVIIIIINNTFCFPSLYTNTTSTAWLIFLKVQFLLKQLFFINSFGFPQQYVGSLMFVGPNLSNQTRSITCFVNGWKLFFNSNWLYLCMPYIAGKFGSKLWRSSQY